MKVRFLLLFFFSSSLIFAQDYLSDTLTATIIGNDTLMVKVLTEVEVVPRPRTDFRSRRHRRIYGRLLRDVKKTLPYAHVAADLLVEVNDSLHKLDTKKDQNDFMKIKEKELFSKYEPVLRRMTRRQGRLLIKLIDRECQITSYEVVKIYRGSFSAFFWQGIARIFGTDLKSGYDALGEDSMIEEIVVLVEAGVV